MVDLHSVILSHNSPVTQILVDLILSDRMFDVIVLDLLGPWVVEVVHLAGHFAAVLQIVGPVDFWVTAFTKNG